jgi:hypothetical protein
MRCGEQQSCRIPRKIFLPDEVFNTSVDKLVEKRRAARANYTILSSLKRFALFMCNSAGCGAFSKVSAAKSFGVEQEA